MQNDFGTGATGLGIGALITGFFAWLVQWSKGRSDKLSAAAVAQSAVEVAVMAEWQKLNGALSSRVSDLESELAKVRTEHASEIEKIRREHSAEIDEMRKKHRTEMRTLRDQNDELRRHNEGLQRMIAQNSQSTAHLIEGSPKRDEGDDL